MPVMCIQCAMRAMVNGEPPPIFDETEAEHMRRYHSDPEYTQRERQELERLLAEKQQRD